MSRNEAWIGRRQDSEVARRKLVGAVAPVDAWAKCLLRLPSYLELASEGIISEHARKIAFCKLAFSKAVKMPEKYHWFELELLYPENWRVEEDTDATSLLVQSPSGSFLSITRPGDLQAAYDGARLTMEQEYGEMETENVSRLLDEAILEGVTQRFIYLDFVITSHLYKLETEDGDFPPLLVQYQGEDRDMDQEQAVFEAILTSLLRKTST